MSLHLRGALKKVGMDLDKAWPWIEEGMNVAADVDPPLGLMFSTIETVLSGVQDVQAGTPLNASQLQTIVTGIAEVVTKTHAAATPAPLPA